VREFSRLVAATGDSAGGKTLTSFGLGPLINNNGDVAFLGLVSGGGGIITASKPPSCGAGTILDTNNECVVNPVTIAGFEAALAEAQAQRDAILTTLFEFLRVFGVI